MELNMTSDLSQNDRDFIEHLMTDKKAFDVFVYTPWREAVRTLEERQNNTVLSNYLHKTLPLGVPPLMKGKMSMIFCRYVATPNFEVQRFVMCADVLTHLQPLIFEHTEDKFADLNIMKRLLGKMRLYKGRSANGETIAEYKTIVNVNSSNGHKISEILTIWGESLVDFHRNLFFNSFPHMESLIWNASSWYYSFGGKAENYYIGILSLALQHSILFENFLFSGREAKLTQFVVLPTILKIYRDTGIKPLIVALEPTDVEEDLFWFSYPHSVREIIDKKCESLG